MTKNREKSSNYFDKIIDSITYKNIDEEFELIINYKKLIDVNISNLIKILENEETKSYILFNFGFIIELCLKTLLLKHNICNFKKISDLKHNISTMYNMIFENCDDGMVKKVLRNIKDKSSLIKMDNGNSINYDDYTHFKYNNKLNSYNLIFRKDICDREKGYILEVLECIELIIKI